MRNDYDSNYLAHYGILGMKWGVRRYQNEDGTLTEAGKRRLSQGKDNRIKYDEHGRVEKGQEAKAYSRIHQEVSSDYQNIGNIANSTSNASRTGGRIARSSARRQQQKAQNEMDVSQMSDQELQKAVNRMNLERNYKSLKAEQIGAGKRYVADILDDIGDVVAIGASAAAILTAIYALKK